MNNENNTGPSMNLSGSGADKIEMSLYLPTAVNDSDRGDPNLVSEANPSDSVRGTGVESSDFVAIPGELCTPDRVWLGCDWAHDWFPPEDEIGTTDDKSFYMFDCELVTRPSDDETDIGDVQYTINFDADDESTVDYELVSIYDFDGKGDSIMADNDSSVTVTVTAPDVTEFKAVVKGDEIMTPSWEVTRALGEIELTAEFQNYSGNPFASSTQDTYSHKNRYSFAAFSNVGDLENVFGEVSTVLGRAKNAGKLVKGYKLYQRSESADNIAKWLLYEGGDYTNPVEKWVPDSTYSGAFTVMKAGIDRYSKNQMNEEFGRVNYAGPTIFLDR